MFAGGDICNSRIVNYLRTMREITHIVVHCLATPEGRPHTVKEVTKWHQARGWRTIGLRMCRTNGNLAAWNIGLQ
jgi:hypothetical protein